MFQLEEAIAVAAVAAVAAAAAAAAAAGAVQRHRAGSYSRTLHHR